MGKVTRRESEDRAKAVMDFFLANPYATGDDAQKALVSGKLTGRPGVSMGIKKLFDLKREAERMSRAGGSVIAAQPVAREVAGPLLADMRALAGQLQKLLAQMPAVEEVRVSRAGARIVKRTTTEEPL